MSKFLSITLMLMLFSLPLGIIGCGDSSEKIDPKDYKNVVEKLDEAKEIQSEADKEISKLNEEIEALEIEKQRLIAEKKRLEADIIDLEIKDRKENL